MLTFFIFLIVLMLLDLCWKSDKILDSRVSKEYHIVVIKQDKKTDNDFDIDIDYGAALVSDNIALKR